MAKKAKVAVLRNCKTEIWELNFHLLGMVSIGHEFVKNCKSTLWGKNTGFFGMPRQFLLLLNIIGVTGSICICVTIQSTQMNLQIARRNVPKRWAYASPLIITHCRAPQILAPCHFLGGGEKHCPAWDHLLAHQPSPQHLCGCSACVCMNAQHWSRGQLLEEDFLRKCEWSQITSFQFKKCSLIFSCNPWFLWVFHIDSQDVSREKTQSGKSRSF